MTDDERIQELVDVAQRMAATELLIRMSSGGDLLRCERELEQLRAQADCLRRSLPEVAEKEFWWDVPFTPGAPKESEEDTFHMESGFYLETDEWENCREDGKNWMRCKPKERPVKDLISYYVTFEQSYIILYMDKKKMRRLIKYPAQVRTIYHAERICGAGQIRMPINVDSSYQTFLREAYEQDMEEMENRLQERLAESERRWDMYEIFSNAWERNAAMTNEEAWGLGKMSTQDYFSGAVWRDYRQEEIRAKVSEEKAARQRQLEQMRNEYRRNLRRTEQHTAGEQCRLHLMAVGEAVYCQGELVALVAYQGKEPVYEIQCAADFLVSELSGKIYGIDKMFEKSIAKIPLFEYMLQAYGNALPLYQVLDPRPLNCPDGAWRMWAEARWAQTLNLLNSIQ